MEREGEEGAEGLKEAHGGGGVGGERERTTNVDLTFQFCEAQFYFLCLAVDHHRVGQCRENAVPLVVHTVIWGELEKDASFLRYFTAICWKTVVITM